MCRNPYLDHAFIAELALRLQAGTNRLRDAVRFGVRWRDDEGRLWFAVLLLFSGGGKIGGGQLLVAVRIGNLLDPAELIKLLECLARSVLR